MSVLNTYNLKKANWDSIVELDLLGNETKNITASVKSKFTRMYDIFNLVFCLIHL